MPDEQPNNLHNPALALRIISDALEEDGRYELADAARDIAQQVEIMRGVISSNITARVVEGDGSILAYPAVRREIDRWIANPRPKLPGITIELISHRQTGWLNFELQMRGTHRGNRWSQSRMIDPDLQDVRNMVHRNLDGLHESAIRLIR